MKHWTPDSKAIVFWTAGQFHKLNLKDQSLQTIPVKLSSEMQYADAVRFDVDVAPAEFDVKMIRWAQKSPDGKNILFQALGKLYLKDIKSGKMKRLTRQNDHDEYYPRFSNDGKQVVYTTWNDQALGTIRVVSARGGKGKVISKNPGHYIEPSFSHDGEWVTYRKISGGYLLSPKWSIEPGLYVTNLDKGTHTRISHDGKWVAFVHQYNAYVAPFVSSGKRQNIGPNSTALPVKKISSRAGEYLTWLPDNETVSWYHGPYYFERSLNEAFDFLPGAPETMPEPVSEGINLSFRHKADIPSGIKALVGANVVTMRDADNQQEVIEGGVVVIDGNKIVAVGKAQVGCSGT